MTKRTVYQANPDIYEHDLRAVLKVIERLNTINEDNSHDLFINDAELNIHSANGYPVGTLRVDEDQWIFTPHNDSDIEVEVNVL